MLNRGGYVFLGSVHCCYGYFRICYYKAGS